MCVPHADLHLDHHGGGLGSGKGPKDAWEEAGTRYTGPESTRSMFLRARSPSFMFMMIVCDRTEFFQDLLCFC